MAAPSYTIDDISSRLVALLPRGRVWPRDISSVLAQTMKALAPTFWRLTQRADYLLIDAFPTTTTELLPEWEKSLGLPDPCIGPEPTLETRRNSVVARLTSKGGQSMGYFIALAETLGFTVTISQFAPFRVGISTVGTPLYGRAWAFHWEINAPTVTAIPFRVGLSTVGEPLRTWNNAELECLIREYAPAQTTVGFHYS